MKKVILINLLLLGVLVFFFFNEPITEAVQTQLDYLLTQKNGEDALRRNDWSTALVTYEVAHDKYPDNPYYQLMLAKIYRRQASKYQRVGGLEYTVPPTNDPDGPPKKKQKTTEQLRQQAEQLLRRVLLAEPENEDAWRALGSLLAEDPKRYMDAVPVFQDALKRFPESATLLKAMGNLYKFAGERRDPEDFSRQNLAIRHWLYEWAVYYYRLSLAADPAQHGVYFNLGVLYHLLDEADPIEKRENLTDSVRAYCNAKQLKPNQFETRYNLGLALIDLRMMDAGFRQLSEAIRLLSESDKVYEAQQLAKHVQGIRNAVYYDDATTFESAEQSAGWLKTCTTDVVPTTN